MAETKTPLQLATDPSRINPTGASGEDLNEYQKSLDAQIKSLEERYANPNWFKVAAGFLKPQLGGFAASLGSASEALGQNVEEQRAAELPIAQMRSQLAQSKILTGQNKTQSDEFEKWRQSGKPMDQATFARIVSVNPASPVADAAKAAYEGQRKDLEYTSGQQRLMMDAISTKLAKGMALSQPEKEFLNNLTGQLSLRQEAKPLLPGGAPVGAEGPPADQVNPAVARRLQSDADSLSRELNRLPAGDSRRVILEDEMSKLQESARKQGVTLGGAPSAEAPTGRKEETSGFYPPSFTPPKIEGLSDQDRAALMQAWTTNALNEEKNYANRIENMRQLSLDPVYSTLDSHYTSSIDMIKNNPQMAKKVFNLLRGEGGLQNQVLSALQAGVGFSLGNVAANVNLPIQTFQSSGLNTEEQMFADKLVNSMLTVGSAKLAAQGITPEKGEKAYFDQLMTKANLNQNPGTALHILQKDHVTFDTNKKLYDTVVKEHGRQQQNVNTLTPYADVFNHSPEVKRIGEEAKKRMAQHESHYQEAIRRANERRANP